ncbi:hypothetical protein A3752_07715 [Oleiphilus sp. HI0081]|uniref:FAD-dependent oxidoreductase n=2 Tax=Oleiphilus TaxID=141450 RepID=UPI0007C2CBA1|nr:MULTISPECIES: FAD-dependent oxidoreductase [unclassified Oleiphilus]KZY80567.1 hypothetical protein A3741_18615 [Oleiphilus sp. HI0069]KZY96948.1 hypothetical protein A3743_00460 [Oleiphilus sp. HI0072]KZZ09219.1 hypothetical protein A3749_13775 [Oleiphilus sp. HI0078]KZZ21950.1 hypothetical protein A3752_07715 [Oleiphilus sp. HI0081]KZY30269.1 hypothetical protein A3729_10840 [Oleiphilus sp. HI0043]
MKKSITRRDFLNGSALAIGAMGLSSSTAWAQLLGASGEATTLGPLPADYYPPTLTGLRGSHKGSFEVAHSLAWRGEKPQHYQKLHEHYDLVIVGGGISGLSAAWFYRKKMGHDARILILDNHDDFGGHAKRNEFQVKGKTLLGAGGSQNLEFPDRYDDISRSVLDDLGIDTDIMESNMTQDYPLGNTDHDAGMSIATDNGHVNLGGNWINFLHAKEGYREAIERLPYNKSEKEKLIEFVSGEHDYLDELSFFEKYKYSKTTSYNSFLRDRVGFSGRTIRMLDVFSRGMFGYSGWKDSILHAIMLGAPGLRAMGWLGEVADFLTMSTGKAYEARYFPDGNATVARLLVSKLIPSVAKGEGNFTNIATKRLDYSELDRERHTTKIGSPTI